jgi:hypothetical protein
VKRETRYDYAAAVAMRYQRSGREQKGWILDEFCAATGYNRKYAIKLLRGPFPRAALPPGHGRPPVYGPEEVALLRPCWQIADYQAKDTLTVGKTRGQTCAWRHLEHCHCQNHGVRVGGYTTRHPEKVEKLFLYAPRYNRLDPSVPPPLPERGVPMRVQPVTDFAGWDTEVKCENQFTPAIREVMTLIRREFDPLGSTWGTEGVRRFRYLRQQDPWRCCSLQ